MREDAFSSSVSLAEEFDREVATRCSSIHYYNRLLSTVNDYTGEPDENDAFLDENERRSQEAASEKAVIMRSSDHKRSSRTLWWSYGGCSAEPPKLLN